MKRNLQQSDREHSKRWINPIKKAGKKKHSFSGGGHTIIERMSLKTLFGKPILDVPAILNFVSTGLDDVLTQFLSDLDTVLNHYPHIYLSFENTKEVRLPMLLTIYAIQDKHDSKISILWSKESKWVNRSLISSGSFSSSTKRRADLFDTKVPYIPVIYGSNDEFKNLTDDLVDAIDDKYYNGCMPDNIEARISQAIFETLENVGRHAYPNENYDRDKKWWLICSVTPENENDERLMYLAIYDAGRGIPLSLEDSQVFQHRVKTHYPEEYNQLILGEHSDGTKQSRITHFVRSMNAMIRPLRDSIGDSGLIYASMMHDMTRLDDDSHGQGSVSIKDVVTDDRNSNLIILSNKGCYQYNKGSEEEHLRFELQNELSGTLLQWSIKLDDLC
ncbi:hypothetical protein [Vibrio sp. 624788]|uniref:hypothetical protein n=1 Tax=Vibrio sp. 624788 TaxID=1234362 RepID=UPI0002E86CF1|nr:hypothetical protein [Vibrio sp. 624788]